MAFVSLLGLPTCPPYTPVVVSGPLFEIFKLTKFGDAFPEGKGGIPSPSKSPQIFYIGETVKLNFCSRTDRSSISS